MQYFGPLIVVFIIIALIATFAPWLFAVLGAGIVALIIVGIVKQCRRHYYESTQYTNGYVVDYSFETRLVGVTFNGIQNILPTLQAGMIVRFVREKHNAYDKNAIRAECCGRNIGHLSADTAAKIAPIMDSGLPVTGSIEAIIGGYMGKNYGCNVNVVVYKKKTASSVKPQEPKKKISEIKCSVEHIDESNPLYKKNCAIFGRGTGKEIQNIVDLGGIVKTNVKPDTDYVIALDPDWLDGSSVNAGKARELIKAGYPIKVMGLVEYTELKRKYLGR